MQEILVWLRIINSQYNLPFLEYKQEKTVLVLEQYFKLDPRSESTILSTTVFTIILSAHYFN